MNLKDIQELIKFVAKSGATDVNLEIDNIKIYEESESVIVDALGSNEPVSIKSLFSLIT